MGSTKVASRSMHEEMFWRSRLNAAFRTGWACFMAGLILQIGSVHVQWVTFPIFAYVMCVTVVGESTLGKALEDTLGVVIGTIQGAGMTILVMQVLSPKRMSIGLAITCICISSFIITYPRRTHILSKRVALAHSSIIYITAVVQKENMHEVFFPLRLAGTTIVGATCGLIALLVPLPRLAMFQVLSQTRLSARITSERLKVIVDAFCANDPTQASALNLQAKSLAKIGSTVHADIASKEGEMGWEVRRFLQGRSKSLKQLTAGLVSLRKNLVGMELALQEDLTSCPASSKKLLHRTLKDSLIYLTDWARLALRHAASTGMQQYRAPPSHRQIIVEEGHEALSSFDEVLSMARQKAAFMASSENDQHVVYEQEAAAAAGSEVELSGSSYGGGKPSFEAHAATFFFLFNLKKFVAETKATFLCGTEKIPADQSKDDHLRKLPATASPRINPGSSPSPSISVQPAPARGSDHGFDGRDNNSASLAMHKLGDQPHHFCERCKNAAIHRQEQQQEEEAARKNQPWLPRFFHRSKKACLSFCSIKEHDPEQLMTAFKMALAMALAGFLGFWFNNRKGYWADITLALGFTGPAKGGSFKIATLRSLGTVSGSIYGLLVVLATESFPVMRLVALVPWVVFTSFLRQSKLFGYAGAVSAFTGAIVILARTNKDSTDQDFTVIRIVEAFLGMASFILIELLVFPRRAASLIKTDITAGLATLQDFAAATFAAPQQRNCCTCSRAAMEELRGKEKQVRSAMKRQNALVKEATEEPQFWFSPFPASTFTKVIEEQGKMVELLHFILSAYEQLREVAEQAGIAIAELGAPLQSSMLIMEEKVVPTLEFLTKVLHVKALPTVAPPTLAETLSVDKLATVDNVTAKTVVDLEAGPAPFVELDTLMKAQPCIATNSRALKSCHFGDIGPRREKRLMLAFEAGAFHITRQLDHLLTPIATSASPNLLPPLHPLMAPEQPHSMESSPYLNPPLALACSDTLSNTIFLSLGALAFSLKGLLHHTIELEKVVHELLQEENPWNLIDFWDTSKSMKHLIPK